MNSIRLYHKLTPMIYIPRLIEPHMLQAVNQFPAIALSGPRQCGKSTLLKHLFSKSHSYISFDDPVVREQALSDPKLFLENRGDRCIIDEIQYVPQLLSYVKILIDENRHKNGRFLFTGSQQFTMIKNLGDSLAGRIAVLDLLPFHVMERKPRLESTMDIFVDTCLRGSFPEVALNNDMNVDTWFGAYLRTYLERDIRTLYNVGSLRDFQQFMRLLAARTSQLLNMADLSRDLGVSLNTIKKWVSILEASQMIALLPPYYQNFGKRVTKAPKVYFLDCGLACYLTGVRNKDALLNGPLVGALFETFIIEETIKSFLFRGKRPDLYFFRSHNGLEVDLLIEKSTGHLLPIEIKATKTPKPAMGDNIRRFKNLFPQLKIEKPTLLCLSQKDEAMGDMTIMSLNRYWEFLQQV